MSLELYRTTANTYLVSCCDEIQFLYICVKCESHMGCYNCEFDLTKAHDCNEQLSTVKESYPQPVGIAQEHAQTCAVFD